MERRQTARCSVPTTLYLVGRRSWSEVPAVLGYDAGDPWAVLVRFGDDGSPGSPDDGVEWLLARDLVHAGLSHPVGEGDVRVWPARDAPDVLFLELRAPSGHALFQVSRRVVTDFLAATERLVPRGSETEAVGVADGLVALLAGEGPDAASR